MSTPVRTTRPPGGMRRRLTSAGTSARVRVRSWSMPARHFRASGSTSHGGSSLKAPTSRSVAVTARTLPASARMDPSGAAHWWPPVAPAVRCTGMDGLAAETVQAIVAFLGDVGRQHGGTTKGNTIPLEWFRWLSADAVRMFYDPVEEATGHSQTDGSERYAVIDREYGER